VRVRGLRYGLPVGQSEPVPAIPGLSGLSVLARGGYATIYRAVQDSVGREVAVKVENRTLDTERDKRRFLREARAAGQMSSHPYVVDLHDVGVTGDQHPYMIMELCDGSYADRLQASPLTPGETRDVGVKIADALAEAHQLGVLHRDVKPANLLISRWGEPQLADFGLAVLAETRETSLTLELVTPVYCPPEIFRPGSPTAAVDVYSLSASLYAMLSGRPPRWQHARSPSIATMLDLFEQPIADLPGVPAPLLDLLRAGLANDPDARPGARQLRDHLAALRLHRHDQPVVRASAPVPEPRSPAADATPRGP
jgi:eukaryotic-like serine/threonine-protein kinase